jgi:hexosaminidase
MRSALIFVFFLALASCNTPPKNVSDSLKYPLDSLSLIPQPNEIISAEGTFSMPSKIRIAFSANCNDEARWLTNQLNNLGFEVNPAEKQSAEITLHCDSAGFFLGNPQYEAYTLEITPDGISLRATYATGLFRGMQTLMQLLETHSKKFKNSCFTSNANH